MLLLGLWNFSKSSNIKKRNRISNRRDPQGIPVSIQIQLLSCPMNLIQVLCTIRKLYIKSISHFRKPFLFRIQRSLLQETLGNAPARSRLNIDTTHPRRVRHAVCTQDPKAYIILTIGRRGRFIKGRLKSLNSVTIKLII